MGNEPTRRLLGLTLDGRPIFEPKAAHSLLLAAAGGGKTTCGAVPWLQSLVSDQTRALVIMDSKDGEIAAQCTRLCIEAGRKVAVIDDFGVLGFDHPCHVSLNPLGGLIASHARQRGELVFTADSANHALIEEPANDARNKYWREEPRALIEYAALTLLNRNPDFATPGGVWSLLADPTLMQRIAKVDRDEGGQALSALARHALEMQQNAEHFPQHRGAAVRALRIFGAESPLHTCGVEPDRSHAELLANNAIVFLVGPQRHMERLGPYYALHLQAFMDAILSGVTGGADLILDEFTNAPLKELVSCLTTMRGYGGRCHMIAQSRSEVQRKYGEKETATIEENAVVKQWFGFSSFEEAERVSKAMGEGQNVSHSLSVNSERQDYSGSYQTGKDRLFSADELMRLSPREQIIHVKDVGFIHALKIRQNEIAPSCELLADNPLEGTRLTPDPIITLPFGKKTQSDEQEARS